jgi:glycosidase
MPAYSYHGYAATNHYKIDPRYGSNEDFVRLSRKRKSAASA